MIKPFHKKTEADLEELEDIADICVSILNNEVNHYRDIEEMRSGLCAELDQQTLLGLFLQFDSEKKGYICFEDFQTLHSRKGSSSQSGWELPELAEEEWKAMIKRIKRPRAASRNGFQNCLTFVDFFDVIYPMRFALKELEARQQLQEEEERASEEPPRTPQQEAALDCGIETLSRVIEEKSNESGSSPSKQEPNRYSKSSKGSAAKKQPKKQSTVSQKNQLIYYEEWEDLDRDSRMQDSIQKNTHKLRNFTSETSFRERKSSSGATHKSAANKIGLADSHEASLRNSKQEIPLAEMKNAKQQASRKEHYGSHSSKTSDAVNCIWQIDTNTQKERPPSSRVSRTELHRGPSQPKYHTGPEPAFKLVLADYSELTQKHAFLQADSAYEPRAISMVKWLLELD